MHLLVNSLYARACTIISRLGTGSGDTGPVENNVKVQPVPMTGDAVISKSGEPEHTSVPPAPGDTVHAIPIRTCPHCGYEIRTWIHGDLSCTRCENDIHPGEGMGSSPNFQVQGICDVSSRL
jgi:hypothetical protein